MLTTHAVGIDLGTTYSCIAYLNEHGEPVTLPNQEGELSTPSVVLFDEHEVIIGTEALRNSITRPLHVVQNAKRFIGDPTKKWVIDGKPYDSVHISTFVLKKLISAAQDQIGPIEQAVITVPAQFGDAQRQATVEAGLRAGLQRVDIINEPVAAALCHVLGSEGLWFTELADEQRIMVYDLGGGTFDLSLVRYQKSEVSVIAGSGDLNLGGIDWNQALVKAACDRFTKDTGEDPRTDPESLQFVCLEAEQTKRSLSVRPKAAMTVHHAGQRKTFQIEQELFEKLTKGLVDRTEEITKRMLKDHDLGWAHVDVVLTTGGSSRMPMIRKRLKKLSGRTLNTSLSPDQSIAHGATYYAGMLLTNNKFAKSILNDEANKRLSKVRQRSVNARALGLLVRDTHRGQRVPHYIIPANTPLPTSITQNFGTVKPNQRRVNLQIVESGPHPEDPFVQLGNCVIDDLPPNLPVDSEIAVTIRYDEQARVHVSARDVASGKEAHTEIIRTENVVNQLQKPGDDANERDDARVVGDPRTAPGRQSTATAAAGRAPAADRSPAKPSSTAKPAAQRPAAPTPPVPAPRPAATLAAPKPTTPPKPRPANKPSVRPIPSARDIEDSNAPVPLCNECGEPLGRDGVCPACGNVPSSRSGPRRKKPGAAPAGGTAATPANTVGRPSQKPRPPALPELDDDKIIELGGGERRATKSKPPRPGAGRSTSGPDNAARGKGEEEFWQFSDLNVE
jgi:molecular chaperone DnaK